MVIIKRLSTVDKVNREFWWSKPPPRSLWQVTCYNAIALLLTNDAKHLFVAVDWLIDLKREEEVSFALHVDCCRWDLIVRSFCTVHADACSLEVTQEIAEFHIEVAWWQLVIHLLSHWVGPRWAVSAEHVAPFFVILIVAQENESFFLSIDRKSLCV